MSGITDIFTFFKTHLAEIISAIITIIVLIGGRLLIKQKVKERKFAARLGLKPMSKKDFFKFFDKSQYSFFYSRLAPPNVDSAFCGSYNGHNICLFLLVLVGNYGAVKQTAVLIRLNGAILSKFVLRPIEISKKISKKLSLQDIIFKNNPIFSEKYFLKGENEDQVLALFQANVINFFEQTVDLSVETNGDEIVIFKDKDFAKPEQYKEYIERAISISKLFQNK